MLRGSLWNLRNLAGLPVRVEIAHPTGELLALLIVAHMAVTVSGVLEEDQLGNPLVRRDGLRPAAVAYITSEHRGWRSSASLHWKAYSCLRTWLGPSLDGPGHAMTIRRLPATHADTPKDTSEGGGPLNKANGGGDTNEVVATYCNAGWQKSR
jgi:hypothetical protein